LSNSAALINRGAEPVTEIEGGAGAGGNVCYLRDPEGNVFETGQRLGEELVFDVTLGVRRFAYLD
jgi:hypothetical protein